MVMHEPGHQIFRTSSATADGLGRFEHRDGNSSPSQTRRGGEPIRPAADDDCA